MIIRKCQFNIFLELFICFDMETDGYMFNINLTVSKTKKNNISFNIHMIF